MGVTCQGAVTPEFLTTLSPGARGRKLPLHQDPRSEKVMPRLWPNWRFSGRNLARLVGVGMALVAYLIGTVGFPLPVRVCKDGSIPFMCQDNPCGCKTA